MNPDIYTQTDRQKDTHTHTNTHTHVFRHTFTHAHTHTHTLTQKHIHKEYNQPSHINYPRLIISTVKQLVFIVCDSL